MREPARLLALGSLVALGAAVEAQGTVLWQDAHTFATPDSVAVGAGDSWVAAGVNDEKVLRYPTVGSGTASWEDDWQPDAPTVIQVASAEAVSLAVVLAERAQTDVIARAYSGGSSAAAWRYDFDPGIDRVASIGVDVSDDGSTVLATAYDVNTSRSVIVVLDPATGVEVVRRLVPAIVSSLEASADGSRAVVAIGTTVEVIETAGLTALASFSVTGPWPGDPRISDDGSTVVGGGADVVAWRDTGVGWTQAFAQADPNEWYGEGLALSADGSTLFAASHAQNTTDAVTVRVVDLDAGVELTRRVYADPGNGGDAVERAEASDDGTVFAVATRGTTQPTHPEVLVFDPALNEVASADLPGSAMALDMTPDGRFVLVGSRLVHFLPSVFGGQVTLLAVDAGPIVYCTAKASSAGCLAAITTSDPGAQPVSGAADYSVLAQSVQGLKAGIFFFGLSGPAAAPFSGGTLCLQPPLKRTPIQFSGGAGPTTCDGSFAHLVNDGVSLHDPGPGSSVWWQSWYRDPDNGPGGGGTALSDAVVLTY